MKSGIIIRVEKLNVDIVDTDVVTFKKWWDTLDEPAKLRTVRHLLMMLAEE